MAEGWTSQRDFPAPQGKTFMQQFALQQQQEMPSPVRDKPRKVADVYRQV